MAGTLTRAWSWFAFICIGLVVCLAGNAIAASTQEKIQLLPQLLQPWAQWLQLSHPDWQCHTDPDKKEGAACVWPGFLSIETNAQSGKFSLAVSLQKSDVVRLPGSVAVWPTQIQVMNQSTGQIMSDLAVGRAQETPVINLPAGRYLIRGELSWLKAPKSIPIPEDIAYVQAKWIGEVDTRMWIRQGGSIRLVQSNIEAKPDQLELDVYRRFVQGTPQILDTWIRLTVTGQPRTILLPDFRVPGTAQLSVSVDLPIQQQSDGRFQIQAKPGQYWLQHQSRFLKPHTEFSPVQQTGLPEVEFWSFHQKDQQMKTIGEQVNSQQVQVPDPWQHLPAFRLTSTQGLKLEAVYDQKTVDGSQWNLRLHRNIWLDFHGDSLVSVDNIQGSLGAPWRLELDQTGDLQRVTHRDKPLLITKNETSGDGIELRDQTLSLEAIIKWPFEQGRYLPATGWSQVFDSVDAHLHLPPGWSLLAVTGPNASHDHWLGQWRLWDLFLVLLGMVLSYRVMPILGFLSSAGLLVLLNHDWFHVTLVWLLILIGIATAQKLPQGKLQAWLYGCVSSLTVVLVLATIGLSVVEIRQAIYPQLEHINKVREVTDQASPKRMQAIADAPTVSSPQSMEYLVMGKQSVRHEQSFDRSSGAQDLLQTGLGRPEWTWRSHHIYSGSQVGPNERVGLILLHPWGSFAWALLALVSLYLAIFVMIRSYGDAIISSLKHNFMPSAPMVTAVLALLILLPLGVAPNAQAEGLPQPQALPIAPSDSLLASLEHYLSPEDDCQCAAIESGDLRIVDDQLTWRMRISTPEATSLALPVSEQWQPESVFLNGVDALDLLRRGKHTWLLLQPGVAELVITGPVLTSELRFRIPNPIPRFEHFLKGWALSNDRDTSTLIDELVLEKRILEKGSDAGFGSPSPFLTPIFLKVHRAIHFGTEWTLRTTVERVAPITGPLVYEVPLLSGEKPLDDVTVKNGSIEVNLSSQQQQVVWTSILTQRSPIQLVAAHDDGLSEYWTVVTGQQWRTTYEGLPPDQQIEPFGYRWSPLGGQTVDIHVTRPDPKAAYGQSVESVRLTQTQGAFDHQMELNISLLAAVPGEYWVQLPADATVNTVTLNGIQVRQLDGKPVSVQLNTGRHELEVHWSAPNSGDFYQSMPAIASSIPFINLTSRMLPSQSSWVVGVTPAVLGPAVLYWPILIVVFVAGFLLYFLGKKCSFPVPLKLLDWILLGIGTSTLWHLTLVPFALWLFSMSWRGSDQFQLMHTKPRLFKLMQVLLLSGTIGVGLLVFSLIKTGLLSSPEMFITGYGSNQGTLNWFFDGPMMETPEVGFYALQQWHFSVLMLMWALWMAFKTVNWFGFGFKCWLSGGFWPTKEKPAGT